MTDQAPEQSPDEKYEALFQRLQKQYEDKLLRSHSLLTQYQALTHHYGTLTGKKNTLLDVMAEYLYGVGESHENGVHKPNGQNGHSTSVKKEEGVEDEEHRISNIIIEDPSMREKLERILNKDFEGDSTLHNLTEWAGILESSDEQVGLWLKKFLSNWKQKQGKKRTSNSGGNSASKKSKTDNFKFVTR